MRRGATRLMLFLEGCEKPHDRREPCSLLPLLAVLHRGASGMRLFVKLLDPVFHSLPQFWVLHRKSVS